VERCLFQELMHQQLAGRQLQQLTQPGNVVTGLTSSAEKPRNQARTASQQPSRSDAMTLAYPHGSFPRPISGPVQGVQNHQQRVQSSSSAPFSGMAPPAQQTPTTSALPVNAPLPPQAQIPPQFLPHYQAHLAAMQKSAGQGGVMMAQTRPMSVSGAQLASAVDQSRIGAGTGAPMIMTSSGLPLGGFPNAVPMSIFYQPMHTGSSSVSGGTAPDVNPSFVMYHNPTQSGDARTQLITNLQANTGTAFHCS
jgi:SWI/SNF-related matrix-associated actin-dependent regulator of chromatin subfamily A protein 2/4